MWARKAMPQCYNLDDGEDAGEPAKFARFGVCAVRSVYQNRQKCLQSAEKRGK